MSTGAVCSCVALNEIGSEALELLRRGTSPKEYRNQVEQGQLREHYLYSILYLGMPEEEFVRRFTKAPKRPNPHRPYIIQRDGQRYILLVTPAYDNDRARVTFQNGALVKFEEYGEGTNPWGYSDSAFLLKEHAPQ